MQATPVENFDSVCARVAKLAAEALDVSKLAAEAFAEHRRRIAQLESIRREAAALYEEVSPGPEAAAQADETSAANPTIEHQSPFAPMPDDRRRSSNSPHFAEWAEIGMLLTSVAEDDQGTDDRLRVAMQRAEAAYPEISGFRPEELFDGADTSDEFVPEVSHGL